MSERRGGGERNVSEHSVLAETFVPEDLRRVNHLPVAATLFGGQRIDASIFGPKGLIVPFVPVCYCRGTDSKQVFMGEPLHCFPIPRSVPSNLYYATQHRIERLLSSPSSLRDVASGLEGDHAPSQNGTDCLPNLDDIESLEVYVQVWESILELERKDVLLRYERFSQYSKAIELQTAAENPSGANPSAVAQHSQANSVALIEIQGIADASPPLMVGDIVLLRPTHPISLPFPNQQRRPLSKLDWSSASNVVEIQSTVQQVRRSFGLRKDAVRISWLDARDSAMVLFSMKILSQVPENYNVRFVPSASHHERCLTALDWLVTCFQESSCSTMIEFLYPTSAPSDLLSADQTELVNDVHSKKLNHKQLSFVKMMLARSLHPSMGQIRGPLVLTGPAGTGKTKTMLCAVHAVLEARKSSNFKHRVLICTPSHTASDVVTRRLGKYLSRNELFRLYAIDRPIATVPVDVLGFCRQSDDQTGAFVLPDVPILMQFQVIVCTCSDAHLLYRIGLTNQQLRVRRQCFETYMQKSCEGTNLLANIEGVLEPHFTHLFIDEAAQATEPETLIPLSVVLDPEGPHRKVEIALVGDPRQLSPSVYSVEAATAGLERSWMERLLHRPVSCLGGGSDDMLGPDFVKIEDWLHYSLLSDGHDQLSFFLTLNYRGHPSFLMTPSAVFYADKLNSVEHHKDGDPGETFWCAKIRYIESLSDPVIIQNEETSHRDEPDEVKCRKQFSWPLHFRGVVGRDASVTVESGFASNSWENFEEAETVVEICALLVAKGVATSSIGIMAPFRGQVVLIRKLLRKKHLGGINVGTIEDYQSVEFDVILLSLVRSTQSFVEHDIRHRMGVFGQPKRSNVALTRAEFLFIVVGNPNLMVGDRVWKQFLLFCNRNGLYYGKPPDDTALLRWTTNSKLVRSLESKSTVDSQHDGTELMVISSLERLLRK